MSLPVKPNVSYPMSIHRAHEVITALSDAYDDLKALLDYECGTPDLEDRNGDRLLFGLTPQETIVLHKLSTSSLLTTSRLAAAINLEDSDARVPLNQIKVIIFRLRNKLTPFGACILTRTGVGYSLKNLELARENAKNGIVLNAYEPGKRSSVTSQEIKDEAVALLQRDGPATCSQLLDKLTCNWQALRPSRFALLSKWLREEERVVSTKRKLDCRWVHVWQIRNTVA